MKKRIIINGVEYRRTYEQIQQRMLADRDGDGVPDALAKGSSFVTTEVTTRIVVNGVEYRSVDEMPPEVRRTYKQALASMGVPHQTSEGNTIGVQALHATTLDGPLPEDQLVPTVGHRPQEFHVRLSGMYIVIIILLGILAAIGTLLLLGYRL